MRLLALFLLAKFASAADSYLFTSFRSNGETGVFLATSEDGRRWTPLNGNRPWIRPQILGMLMRDPFLTRGPDVTSHVLWLQSPPLAVTTRDWKQFSPSRLWFDPGFNSVDSTLVQDGKRWIMIFKDERVTH